QLFIRLAFMQRVTGKTREFSALVARRLDQSIVLSTDDANHPVWPKEVAEKVGIACEIIGEPAHRLDSRRANNRSGLFEIIPWPVAETALPPILRLIDPLHRMTKTTDLSRPD